jgi:hypothetical protein
MPLDLLTPVPKAIGGIGEAIGNIGKIAFKVDEELKKRAEDIKKKQDTATVLRIVNDTQDKMQQFVNERLLKTQGANAFNLDKEYDKFINDIITKIETTD